MSTEINIGFLVALMLYTSVIASWWIIFRKAGRPGWASIIPIYNIIVLLDIADLESGFFNALPFYIPVLNIIWFFILSYGLSSAYKKDIGFTFGLFLFPYIFFPILAFSKERISN